MESRNEELLQAILDGQTVTTEPQSRNEALLKAIANKPSGGSSVETKYITYVGTGSATNVIQFDHSVNAFCIGNGYDSRNQYFMWLQCPHETIDFRYFGASVGIYSTPCEWSEDKKTLTIKGENAQVSFNIEGYTYYLFYM